MYDMRLIIDFTRAHIPPNWKPNPSGWVSGNCPVCATRGHSHDTKGRGGFYFPEQDTFQYNCFNCNFTAGWPTLDNKIDDRLKALYKAFGADSSDIQRLQLRLLEDRDIESILLKKVSTDDAVEINWKPVELPEGAKPISEYTEVTPELERVLEYMVSRGLDPMDSRFYYSPSMSPARMKNRFMHVFFYKGVIVGYTARWVGTITKEIPKYFTKQPMLDFVYGLDKQSNKKIVIVTEGQLDAYFTDGIAIGSNNINVEQGNIIDSLKKKIIVLPDADSASKLLVERAVIRGWYVSFPEWSDCKDAADAALKYGQLFMIQTILDSAIHNPLKIQVKMKSYCK
jgi:hypothetical protein